MVIKEYTITQLEEFIYSDIFKKSAVIPITTLRAISHINNPRASREDIVLIVAFENDDIIGYIGILPDNIFVENTELKIGWISCWWTDNIKGKTIALELFFKALEVWDNNILITDLIPKTKFIVDKTDEFFYTEKIRGIRGFLRFNLNTILPSKHDFYKRIIILLQVIDFTCNLINEVRLFIRTFIRKFSEKNKNIKVQFVDSIDEEISSFINLHSSDEIIRRQKSELNWVKNYPWISNTDSSKTEGKKYYFSSYAKIFENNFLKIFNNGTLVGFMMVSQRNEHLRIPYIFFDKTNTSIIVKVIYDILTSKKISMFTTFNPFITEYIKNNPSPFFYKRKIYKDLAVSYKFQHLNLKNVILQDGDGDCAFT